MFYWLYKTRIGGRSYSSTADKTEQYLLLTVRSDLQSETDQLKGLFIGAR